MFVPARSLPLGVFTLTPILDGYFGPDGGAMFGVVPSLLWEKVSAPDGRHRIRLAMRPWLVQGGGHTILIDAGAGGKLDSKAADIFGFDGVPSLDARSPRPASPARHRPRHRLAPPFRSRRRLHGTRGGRDGSADVPQRENTAIRRGEWDDACHPHERNRASYFLENYVPLQEAGLLDLIDDDGEVVPGVRVRRTGGHTKHYQIVEIESGGSTKRSSRRSCCHGGAPAAAGHHGLRPVPDGDAGFQAGVPSARRWSGTI